MPPMGRANKNDRSLTRLFNESLETDDSKIAAMLKELFDSIGDRFTLNRFRCDYGLYVWQQIS